MIKTIARSFYWASPMVIQEMYCDDFDYFGIEYWYKDVQQQNSEIEAKKTKNK